MPSDFSFASDRIHSNRRSTAEIYWQKKREFKPKSELISAYKWARNDLNHDSNVKLLNGEGVLCLITNSHICIYTFGSWSNKGKEQNVEKNGWKMAQTRCECACGYVAFWILNSSTVRKVFYLLQESCIALWNSHLNLFSCIKIIAIWQCGYFSLYFINNICRAWTLKTKKIIQTDITIRAKREGRI